MSDDPATNEPRIPTGGASRQPTPKASAARSPAQNSFAKIVVLGSALLGLLILTGIALFVRPEAMRDLLWAAVTLVA
ncbi:MAG TPA: hypothetical protein VGE74_27915 [Gemmata sp.]